MEERFPLPEKLQIGPQVSYAFAMSRSSDKALVEYVKKKMPARVKKALADAQFDLHYGPGAGGGMGWVKASKIVEEWWDENIGDLVVDDGDNVLSKHDFDRAVESAADDYEKEALQQAIDEGFPTEEQEWIDGRYQTEAEAEASRQAQNYANDEIERATLYDERDVKRLVLGKDWP